MKSLSAISVVFTFFLSGCASSPNPPAHTSSVSPDAKTAQSGLASTDKNQTHQHQSSQTQSSNNFYGPEENESTQPNPEPAVAVCPPGQLMATRIVTGETGTQITEECMTPFARKRPVGKSKRAVAVKIGNRNSGSKVEQLSQK